MEGLIEKHLEEQGVDIADLKDALLEMLVEQSETLNGNLLQDDPLVWLEERDFFNDLMGFAKHLIEFETLKHYKLHVLM